MPRSITITCPSPQCGSTDTEEYGEPIPFTDDFADAARCLTCGHAWALDPAADGACTRCGGNGIPGGTGNMHAPKCGCVTSQA